MITDSDNGCVLSNEIRSRARNMYELSDWERNVNSATSTFIEKPIRREDSLHNIAIKYGVKVRWCEILISKNVTLEEKSVIIRVLVNAMANIMVSHFLYIN